MKRMKRAYASRIACGQAMLEELQRKFPTTNFELSYFDPDSWDTWTEAGMAHMIKMRVKYKHTLGEIKKCVRVIWDEGAAKTEVEDIANKYLQHSIVKMDDGWRRIPNVGFDELGNPTQMGLFKEIFLERNVSHYDVSNLSNDEISNLDSTTLS